MIQLLNQKHFIGEHPKHINAINKYKRESINFGFNDFISGRLAELVNQVLQTTSVKSVSLNSCDLNDSHLADIIRLVQNMETLQFLDLSKNSFSDSGITAIFKAIRFDQDINIAVDSSQGFYYETHFYKQKNCSDFRVFPQELSANLGMFNIQFYKRRYIDGIYKVVKI